MPHRIEITTDQPKTVKYTCDRLYQLDTPESIVKMGRAFTAEQNDVVVLDLIYKKSGFRTVLGISWNGLKAILILAEKLFEEKAKDN